VASTLAQVLSVTEELLTDCCDEEQKPRASVCLLALKQHCWKDRCFAAPCSHGSISLYAPAQQPTSPVYMHTINPGLHSPFIPLGCNSHVQGQGN